MIYRSTDPVLDAERYAADCEEQAEKYPTCDICGNIITDETFYEVSGEILCESCMVDTYRRYTSDYIGE